MTNQIQLMTATDATEGLTTSSNTLVAHARAMVIVDETSHGKANEMLVNIKRAAKDVEADREKIYRPAKQVVDEISRRYKPVLDMLEAAEKALKNTIGTWQQEQARIAEQKRLAEIKEREEAALRAAEAAEAERKAQEEVVRAAAAAEAARLAEEGQAEAAKAVEEAAEATLADIKAEADKATSQMIDQTTKVESTFNSTAQVAGGGAATTRMVWCAEVEDKAKLPAEFVIPNMTAINQAVRDGVREIAGVKIYQKPSVAVRI